MPPPTPVISTLDGAKAWLATLPAGGSTDIGKDWFAPAIAQQVFAVLPESETLSLSGIKPDAAAATLTGQATVLGEPGCTATISFTGDTNDPLLVSLSIARPKDYRWSPLEGFALSLGNLVGKITPEPVAGAVELEFDCTLFAGTLELDGTLKLPALPGSNWTLAIAETKQPFSSDLLSTLTGSADATKTLPSDVFPLDKFHLNGFEIAFNPDKGTCTGLRVGLEYDPDPPWKPFGEALAISGLVFDFNGHFDGGNSSFQAVATAKTLIGPAHVDVSIQFPDQAILVYLDAGTSLSVTDAFRTFDIALPTGFPDIELSTLSLGLYVTEQHIDFALAIDKPFKIIGDVELDKFHFELGISRSSGSFSGHGDLFALFSVPLGGPNDPVTVVRLSGAYDTSGAMTIAGTAVNVPAGKLIAGLLGKFGVSSDVIPAPICGLQFTRIHAELSRTGGPNGADTFEFDCEAKTTVSGVDVDIVPKVVVTYDETKKTWTTDFKGSIFLTTVAKNRLEFDLEFSKVATDTFFKASFEDKTRVIGFADIAGIFGFDLPTVPDGLDLDLKSVSFRYDSRPTASSLFFGADSTNPNYGRISYVSVAPAQGDRQHVVILAANQTLSLSKLPLVGTELAKIGQVALDGLEAAIAFPAPVSGSTAVTLNAAITAADPQKVYPLLPPAGLPGRILLAANLDLGGNPPRPVSVSLGGGNAQALALAADAGVDDGTHWFDIQKSFGPVSIQKVGVRYSHSTLWALLNASIEAGPVQLGLIGLGAGSPLNTFKPKFTVEGVTLSVAAGPLAFSGALVGQIDPVNLYGELGLSLPGFSIAALGAYANYQSHPSCFLYAVLDAELGGPPFFFVTGLAAGFALNRTLVIPPVGALGSFPLISWATGSGPSSTATGDTATSVLNAMELLATSGVIAPSIGEYWLAIGIKFTSFKLVDSFALLTAKFGNEVEIDLLGISTLSLPPEDPSPIALAELALEASFSPAHGLISVSGQLTPRSFVLSKDCHLTGGFAFYMWYSGDHAGEFVLSLGGYSPQFKRPDYYPVVPRLGLNWQIADNLSISGDEYFALTPSAVMAGGGMRAVWSSGAISAWFSVEADFLLLFKPLHYHISASIELGASITIDLWFTSFTISIHLGVNAQIWGPDFGGEVDVDLYIVSFTIGFGPREKLPDPLLWGDFVTQVLPSRSGGAKSLFQRRQLSATIEAEDTTPAPILQITGTTGILKTLPPVAGAPIPLDWLVDGETIEIAVASTIPLRTFTLAGGGNVELIVEPTDPATFTDQIGVGPSAIAVDDFVSALSITASSTEDTQLRAWKTINAVPKAVWQNRDLDDHGVPRSVDPLKDTVISNALTGFALRAHVPDPKRSLPVEIQYLRYTNDGGRLTLAESDPTVFTVDPFKNETVHATITQDIPTRNRRAMIDAINLAGFSVNTVPNVSALAHQLSGSLLAPPVLRYLVEAR